MARVLAWIAEKANDYLLWHDTRRAAAEPRCPDCEAPESWCYCDEKDRERAIADGAYDCGYEAGREAAHDHTT